MSDLFYHHRGELRRSVTPRRGRPYDQKCSLDVYRDVIDLLCERWADGLTTNEAWAALRHPCTQISVALAFLKERGCVTVHQRRIVPSSSIFNEDAMLEWHALERSCLDVDA